MWVLSFDVEKSSTTKLPSAPSLSRCMLKFKSGLSFSPNLDISRSNVDLLVDYMSTTLLARAMNSLLYWLV
jgi:hypothetical protein